MPYPLASTSSTDGQTARVYSLLVPDDVAGFQVQHVFREILREIGDALQFVGHARQPEGGVDPFGMLDGESARGAVGGVLERIDDLVGGDDLAGDHLIPGHQGLAGTAHGVDDLAGQEQEGRRHLVGRRQGGAAFQDVHGVVGGTFEVAVGVQDRGQGAKIRSHRLVQRDDAEALFLEDDFLAVDLVLDEREIVVRGAFGAGKTDDTGVEEIDDASTLLVESFRDTTDFVR